MKRFFALTLFLLFLVGCCAERPDATNSTPTSTTKPSNETSNPVETTILVSEPSSIPETTCTVATSLPDEQISEKIELESGNHLLTFNSNHYPEGFDYWLYIPENATKNMPFVVFLHGKGEVGNVSAIENYGMIKMARDLYGDNFPFIAINPCLRAGNWVKDSTSDALKELIDHVAELCCVDRDKIILTGHSLGSIGTWFMLSKYGNYFSAAVPISCGCDEPIIYERIAEVPVRAFCGDADELEIKYKGGMERIYNYVLAAGGDIEFTVMYGRNHANTTTEPYTLELFEWMLEQ